MDIGTAKPSSEDRRQIPHHCIDLIDPNQTFSAVEFKSCGMTAIQEIHQRNRLPIVAGGSGLYIDGLLYDFEFGGKVDEGLRKELEHLALADLQARANDIGIGNDEVNFSNKRHLSRAIERGGVAAQRTALPPNVLLVGLRVNKAELHRRIVHRVESMLQTGLLEEVQDLRTQWGPKAPGLLAPGYRAFAEYLDKNCSLEDAKNMFTSSHKKLAKRQQTWFKRNKDIRWVETEQDAELLVAAFLSKFDTITA
jgi:tRNA dimethylallyltransferase